MSDQTSVAGPKRRLPRTRGAAGGVLLIVLGAWGALAPFIGPYYNFGFTPDDEWHWTAARGWLEVLPGGVVFIGGLLLVVSASRATTVLGAVLGIIGGAWFVIGTPLAGPLRLGSPGQPFGTDRTQQAMELLALFTGLGALIIIVAASAFGRLSVVTVRDVDAATRRGQLAADEAAGTERETETADDDDRDEPIAASQGPAASTPPSLRKTDDAPLEPAAPEAPTHTPSEQPVWHSTAGSFPAAAASETAASEPTPSEPTPSEPTPPSEPAPSEPTPSEPTPSEPTPSEPTPSEPTPSEPTPSEPTPSGPGSTPPDRFEYQPGGYDPRQYQSREYTPRSDEPTDAPPEPGPDDTVQLPRQEGWTPPGSLPPGAAADPRTPPAGH